jgi:hypothetical protein
MVAMSEVAELASVIGSKITSFGYRDGCVVFKLDDGRWLMVGSDEPVWYRFDEFYLQ